MDNNDFRILLQAVLDKSGIQRNLKEIQQFLNKDGVKLSAKLETASAINEVKKLSENLTKELKKMDLNLSEKDVNNVLISAFKESQREIIKTQQETDKLNDKINRLISTSQLQKKVSGVSNSYNSLLPSAIPESLSTDYNRLMELSNKLNASMSKKDKADIYKELSILLPKVKNELSMLTNETTKLATESKKMALSNKIQSWYDKNSAAHKLFGAQIRDALAKLNSGSQMTVSELHKIKTEFDQIGISARQAGVLGKSFFDRFKEQVGKFTQWIGVTTIIMRAVNSLRKMKDAVYDVDSSMTNLYKVTDETDKKYASFLSNANKSALEFGRTVSSLIEQTAKWAKLGYNIDEAENLAKISSIYANVGEVSDETAVSDIVTALKSFNIEAQDSIQIIDKLNALGNKYAVSSADLGTGLSNSASALALAGNSIDETLAMITAMTEITQNASESGNALKILSMRLRGKLFYASIYRNMYAMYAI